MKCSQCGGLKFDEDPGRGDMICLDCGAVLSENAVSATVEFVENAGGISSAIGRFISDESQVPGFRESKYITEQRARRRIDMICGQLRLGPDVAVSAFRYYQSAFFRGFTRGRNAMQLAAACVYVAARQLRVNVMLLDLSDAVGINVYQVGRTYSELKQILNLALPEVDPCLFVERFASQLDFEEKTMAVATTAMRLLQRMKKDWMCTGRRPSGLAAASLLVAARVHEFNRSEEDVAKVARISHLTARKRLVEFSKTPSSALSIEAFFTVDYDEEQDPPAFGQATRKKNNVLSELDMGQIAMEIKELGTRIDMDLERLAKKKKIPSSDTSFTLAKSKGLKHLIKSDDADEEEGAIASCNSPSSKQTRTTRDVFRDVLNGIVEPEILDNCVEDLEMITANSGDQLCHLVESSRKMRDVQDSAALDSKEFSASPPDASSENSLKLPHFISPLVEKNEPQSDMKDIKDLSAVSSDMKDLKDFTLDLTGVDEAELEREYFLTPREVMVKATLWFQDNAHYLEAQRKKKAEKLRLKSVSQPKKARGGSRQIYRRQRKLHFNKGEPIVDEDTLDEKPVSKKINYAALDAIVKTSSSSAPTTAATSETVEPAQSDRPNLLLEATLRDTDILPNRTAAASLAITGAGAGGEPTSTPPVAPSSVAQDSEEEHADYEVEEEEEDEEADWQTGADLW